MTERLKVDGNKTYSKCRYQDVNGIRRRFKSYLTNLFFLSGVCNMRRLALCCLFVIGVSGLIAKQPPPLNSETISWDTDYVWVFEEENGDYRLWGAVEVKGKANTQYYVRLFCVDDVDNRHHLYPRGGGEAAPAWDLGKNYDGTVKWNDFSTTIPKNSNYWKQINKDGGAIVQYSISSIVNGNETIKDNGAALMFLAP